MNENRKERFEEKIDIGEFLDKWCGVPVFFILFVLLIIWIVELTS